MSVRHTLVVFIMLALVFMNSGIAFSQSVAVPTADPCGVGTTGNIDLYGIVDLSDLAYLVSYLTGGGAVLLCPDEANINALGIIDLSDLSMLASYLTGGGATLPQCQNAIPIMSASVRVAALADASQMIESIKHLPNDQYFAQMLAYFQSNPAYEASGYDTAFANVWARFTDGVSFIVSRSMEFSPDTLPGDPLPSPVLIDPFDQKTFSQPATTRDERPSLSGAAPLLPPQDIPTAATARVLLAVGNGFPSVGVTTRRLISWLTTKNYSISSTSATVTSLKTVGGDGVFYYLGHGASATPRTGPDEYVISSTSSAVTPAEIAAFENEVAANRLCIVNDVVDYDADGREIHSLRYGITSKFISTYWQNFSDHAVVFINACGSDGSAGFKAAIQAKNGPAYFGWTQIVNCADAGDVAEFMVDRMLGINKHFRKETPAQRPFDAESVYNDLKSRGLHIRANNDPLASYQTKFNYTPGSGNFGVLAPSIRFMAILEHQDTVEMTGIFGQDPGARGKLKVGGTELPIGSWEPGLIRAFIPNTGVGCVGPVTVEVDGRVSNTVNLTEWKGEITYHHNDAGSLAGNITMNCHFRADVHLFRDGPGLAPHPGVTLIIAACEDSYGSSEASGTFTYVDQSNPPNVTTWDWAGFAYLKGLWEHDPFGFLLQGPLNVGAKTFDLQIEAFSNLNLGETITRNSVTETRNLGIRYYNQLYHDPLFHRVHFTFDDLWNINSGFLQRDEACCSRDLDNPVIRHDVVWSQMPASWAPDPDAAQ